MFISPAFAQTAGAAGLGGFEGQIAQFGPLVLIFAVFYFLMIRPQQKRAKEHRELVTNLRRGDKVITQAGIYGTVTKVINEQEVQLEIAEGVRVRLVRSTIQGVVSKTEPVKDEPEAEAK